MAYPAYPVLRRDLHHRGLILVLGMLGSKMDPPGFGLTGTAGALTFLGVAFGIVVAILFAFKLSADNVHVAREDGRHAPDACRGGGRRSWRSR